MRGRGTNPISDDIELLDVEPAPSAPVDHVETASNNRLGAVVAIAGAVAAIALVVGVGNSPAPVEPPDVTIERIEDTGPPLTEREQQEADFGVAIGDGPGLVWQPVGVDINTRSWAWIGDSFVSDNGTTAWSVGYDDAGLAVSQRPSLLLEYPDYQLSPLDGGQLLVPTGSAPDHVIVIRGNEDPERFDLPALAELPTSDLFKIQTWVQGAIVGDRLVAAIWISSSIDLDELRARTDIDLSGVAFAQAGNGRIQPYGGASGLLPDPISFEDAALTDLEVAEAELSGNDDGQIITVDLVTSAVEPVDFTDFQYVDAFVLSPTGELLLDWGDTSELQWDSSTVDGINWSTRRSTKNRWMVSSGTQLFDLISQFTISRSDGSGQVWTETTDPLRETSRAFAGDVVALGRPWNDGIDTGVIVDTGSNDFTLTLFDQGQRFVLRGIRVFEEPLLVGWLEDPSSGASRDWLTGEIVFTEQRTGDEYLRVPELAIQSALAAETPMETIALTRWPVGVDDPEWLITSPVEVFGEGALAVDFLGGGEQLLAIVTTADSFDVYIADTTERP